MGNFTPTPKGAITMTKSLEERAEEIEVAGFDLIGRGWARMEADLRPWKKLIADQASKIRSLETTNGDRLVELVDSVNKVARYEEALKEIDKALETNCCKAPGMGADNMVALAMIGKLTHDVLKDISK